MSKLLQRDVIVTRIGPGYYQCSAVWAGYRRHMLYHGYTKRIAIRLFAAWINQEGK